ncbi:SDR family oxidoreductase [Microbaculum marinum]|uniref:SDR family oxidoreductase n=1 Tax=Microbaculum marinum TaxID=1764581 RepID=A0AAW9RSK9_9HYPH
MRFEGRTALVTGGGTGIGAAVARRLSADGATVAVLGRRREPLEAVAAATGGIAIAADAADTGAVRAALADIRARAGPVDILIANAGGHGMGPTVSMDDRTWAESARANLDTAFVCARECLPDLIERGGTIVIVSSIAGLAAAPEAAGYVTMKHACIGLGKSLARDYGRKGVRTNIVCPGWVTSEMADEEMATLVGQAGAALGVTSVEEAYALVTKHVPIGRPATPEEVANVICFLASAEAAMVNGAVLTVDGGASIVDLPTIAFAD